MNLEKKYCSPLEAAEILGISRTTVYRLIAAGKIPGRRLSPRTVRIPLEALETLGAAMGPQQ